MLSPVCHLLCYMGVRTAKCYLQFVTSFAIINGGKDGQSCSSVCYRYTSFATFDGQSCSLQFVTSFAAFHGVRFVTFSATFHRARTANVSLSRQLHPSLHICSCMYACMRTRGCVCRCVFMCLCVCAYACVFERVLIAIKQFLQSMNSTMIEGIQIIDSLRPVNHEGHIMDEGSVRMYDIFHSVCPRSFSFCQITPCLHHACYNTQAVCCGFPFSCKCIDMKSPQRQTLCVPTICSIEQ